MVLPRERPDCLARAGDYTASKQRQRGFRGTERCVPVGRASHVTRSVTNTLQHFVLAAGGEAGEGNRIFALGVGQ